jgi:excinuclease ABC subunit A
MLVGVSGSGKSSLAVDVLLRALRRHVHGDPTPPGAHDVIHGMDRFRRAVEVDRSRVGGSARATPATYVGAWGEIRALLAKTSEARIRGFGAGRFSFNRGDGRCSGCDGLGTRTIEMHLLPDVHVTCEACGGRRFERETLEVRWRGHDAAALLELTVHEALATFRNVPKIRSALEPMERVGLGYLPLGQPLDTLSGGESQRLRLASELTGRTGPGVLLVLDEPSIGLHPRDVTRLATVLRDLAEAGTTLLVIDHDLELVRRADYVVEMGPGAGAEGGSVVATGTPAAIATTDSLTGGYLRQA